MTDNLTKKIFNMIMMINPAIAAFSTVTSKNRPWVRYVTVTADEDLTIWFSTFASSRKIDQIRKNNEVHLVLKDTGLCGVTTLGKAKAAYIQIQGKADILKNKSSRERVWTDSLEAYFSGIDDPNMRVCRIKPYRIEYNYMDPKKLPEIWKPL